MKKTIISLAIVLSTIICFSQSANVVVPDIYTPFQRNFPAQTIVWLKGSGLQYLLKVNVSPSVTLAWVLQDATRYETLHLSSSALSSNSLKLQGLDTTGIKTLDSIYAEFIQGKDTTWIKNQLSSHWENTATYLIPLDSTNKAIHILKDAVINGNLYLPGKNIYGETNKVNISLLDDGDDNVFINLNLYHGTTNKWNGISIDPGSVGFGRKVNKPQLRLKDFKSHWEKDIDNRPIGNCSEICSFKAISLSKMNGENKPKVIEIFKQLFPLSPKYRPHICVIQLGVNSGMVKPTPQDNNIYHHDLYVADEFSFEEIRQLEIIPLAKDV